MSIAISAISASDTGHPIPICPMPVPRRLHRLAEVRRQEGVTRRAMAHRLGISQEEVRRQEQDSDLPLSTLYAWEKALGVPATEFLVEGETALSTPVLGRARLLRMMKTVRSIAARSKQPSVRRLARFLAGQLVEVMPELKEVEPWRVGGKRRTRSELGQAAFRRFISELSVEPDHDPM